LGKFDNFLENLSAAVTQKELETPLTGRGRTLDYGIQFLHVRFVRLGKVNCGNKVRTIECTCVQTVHAVSLAYT